ncbi:MAG: ribosome maturation factor RimM [Agarilytica sp.]
MTDKRSNLINVGRVSGVFGVKGWVKINSSTEPRENILEYKPWWLKTRHGVKTLEVAEYKVRNDDLIVRFDGVDDRDQAAQYSLVDIAVERTQLPELGVGDYYWDQLIGLTAISEFEGSQYELGKVSRLMETGANDVLVISATENSFDDRERLVPYVFQHYVTLVDLDAGEIRVAWDPEF